MKIVHWLFIVSVALFVSGIAFVIVGARATRRAPAGDPAAGRLVPVASVKQIMNGIVDPAATVVFGAVSSTVTATGTEETMPRTDKEWEAVGNSAAALIESGNLLLVGSRAVDNGEWVKQSRALIETATVALEAIRARSAPRLFDAGEAIYASCDDCHRTYQRGS